MASTRLGQTGPFAAYLAFQAKAIAVVAAQAAAQAGAYTWRSTPATRLKPEKHQWPDLQQIEQPAQPIALALPQPPAVSQPVLPDNPLLHTALKAGGGLPDSWKQSLPPAFVQAPRGPLPSTASHDVPGLPGMTWDHLVTLAEAA